MHAPLINTPEHPPLTGERLRQMLSLARKHVVEGGAMAAGVYYRMILKETSPPKTGEEMVAHGEAALWYARWARSRNKLGEAADWYQQALQADPLATDYRIEYIVKCLLPMGMLSDARFEVERAVKIDPEHHEAWRLLGGVEHRTGNVKASIKAYDKQLELLPDDPNAKLDRATIALDTADYETVRRLCEPVLSTDRRADALHCLAMADYREGNHERAIDRYNAAVDLKCYDPALARWNKSLALHSLGRYLEGWAEHEQRGNQVTDRGMALLMNRFVLPRWNDEPPPARLHLHQEMGHGDAIAMARYAPILVERGYDVRLEVNDSMVDLFARSFPKVQVMPKSPNYPGALRIPPFDYHIPMLSLPAMFKTEVDTVPWQGPYLVPDPQKVDYYREKLRGIPRKIGLCWSSGIRDTGIWLTEYGRRKSMKLKMLYPIILKKNAGTGRAFVSLQVGPERDENQGDIMDLLPENPTWDDTAALIECLDLVVTVDTSVAHLAGAMGKPVYLMMHTEGSWHWMAERPGASWNERSPWYPSVRIYRQKKPHEWDDVIKRVAADL